MLTFIFLNILVLYSAFLIVYKALKIEGAVDSLVALFIIYLSEIILIELTLGLIGALYLKNIVLAASVMMASSYLLTRGGKLCLPQLNLKFYFGRLLENKLATFIFSAVLSFTTVKVLVNLFNPPFGWDSINYHFTFAVEWLKHGNLNIPIVIFDDPSPTYYPINGSLFYFWLILPLKSVFLADLGQLPFFVIAIFCVYGISRKIGLSRSYSFFSAAAFMLIPNFFKQLQIAYVDVMVGALFLVCINWLFLLKLRFNLQNVLIYGLSLGILIGTKTVGMPYSILLIFPFFIAWLKNRGKFSLGWVFISSILLFGSFTYFRNFIETANPLYPLDLKLFNLHIFKGVVDRSVYSSHFIASDYSLSKMLFHEGLGAQALILILPAIFLSLPVAFFRGRRGLDFSLVYLLALPSLIYFLYRYAIPLANIRYLYALMGIGVILGLFILNALKVKKPLINILMIICIFSSIPSLAKRQELANSIIFTVLIFMILISFNRFKPLISKLIFLSAPVVFFLTAILWGQDFYQKNEFGRYSKMVKYSGFWPEATVAWDWLNSNTGGNNIAYTGRAVPFPLYGSNLKNNVFYVSVNDVQPAKLHYFKDSKYEYKPGFESLLKTIEQENNYRGRADYNIWIDNLLKANTDFLFVYSLQQTKSLIFPLEDSWALIHPERFLPVFKNNTIHIYKVIK